ncbi:sialate O-acetylesterase [Coraliomargarita parva]|uniref:sialate O-acetylesterase n=1 Tax=Coraliomargarita parva TaxID=3014050 RepID=UPI0022B37A6A|nr:sialate O-acetylesterase [Coraliomargarita parva]
MKRLTTCSLLLLLATIYAKAEIRLPHIFGDHMVLQQGQANPIWGQAKPGETVTVSIEAQSHQTKAGPNGHWRLKLDPIPTGGPYELKISGSSELTFHDVLVGEVWLSSGQSNMRFAVKGAYHAPVEIASANYPQIRLLSLPNRGTEHAQDDFEGEWKVCSPDTVGGFSAVAYFFGRRIHQTLNVPVGIINSAWGGSSAFGWIDREAIADLPIYADTIEYWRQACDGYTDDVQAQKLAEYKAWEAAGKPEPKLRSPWDPRYSHHRPGNSFNGVIHPIVGYGIRGVIWYQGEADAPRPELYRDLFPRLIQNWRDAWEQGDFPFYWVQLADYEPNPNREQMEDGGLAYIRAVQTETLDKLPNVGQAVIIDTGEARNEHPKDKQTVADRLVRHALAKDYGYAISCESPRLERTKIKDGSLLLHFTFVEKGLYAFDTPEIRGFRIAGTNGIFVEAKAEILEPSTIRVWNPEVPHPIAVRYAWDSNPDCNLYDLNGLPATPFESKITTPD